MKYFRVFIGSDRLREPYYLKTLDNTDVFSYDTVISLLCAMGLPTVKIQELEPMEQLNVLGIHIIRTE